MEISNESYKKVKFESNIKSNEKKTALKSKQRMNKSQEGDDDRSVSQSWRFSINLVRAVTTSPYIFKVIGKEMNLRLFW